MLRVGGDSDVVEDAFAGIEPVHRHRSEHRRARELHQSDTGGDGDIGQCQRIGLFQQAAVERATRSAPVSAFFAKASVAGDSPTCAAVAW